VRKIDVSDRKDGVFIYKRKKEGFMGEIKGHVKLGLCMRYQSGDAE